MTSILVLIASVFGTSLLSGILGMAGGIVLLGILLWMMPVAVAMILHGLVQATANGSRVWFNRIHVQWQVVPPYFVGVGVVGLIFWITALTWSAPVILIVVGLSAWIPVLTPSHLTIDVQRPLSACICGATVTAASILAGTSGPLMDVFFQKTSMNRFELVSTKAFAQFVGHITKVLYYLWIANELGEFDSGYLAWPLVLSFLAFATLGTYLGTKVLERIQESSFRKVTTAVILLLGTGVAASGAVKILGV